ncbi:RNA-directed DNA polymerase, eukaryota [Tanacetum coccineum]
MFNRILDGTLSSKGKEAIRQLSNRLLSKPLATPLLQTRTIIVRPQHEPIENVGDPILHQPARELYPEEIGSQRIQKTIDDMIKVMRKERVASLSAPKIGVPIKIIVLEDTKLYMEPSPNEVNEKQERQPSDLLYVNPPSKPRYCEPKTENHELPDNTVFRRMCMCNWPPSNGEKVPKGRGHRIGSRWPTNKGPKWRSWIRGILSSGNAFFLPGKGTGTCFWKDLWIGDNLLKLSFSRLFALEENKDISVADKMNTSISSSFRRHVRGGVESQQLDQLSLLLYTVILSNMDDRWFWDLNGDGVFQVKDVRSMLDEAFLPKRKFLLVD